MEIGKYKFECVLDSDCILPEFKGSTFRGVFGLSLKKVVCALRFQECNSCLLNESCIYPFIFEPGKFEDSGEKHHVAAPPHPYVIEAPITKKTHWTKGELFDFDIILLGKANEYLPYFVYAIEQMGQTGIGKMIDGFRSTFNLVSVKANRKLIYSGKERKLVKGSFTKNISAGRFAKIKESEISGITVVLQTPLRLKFENNLKRAELPFHVLIRACLRRISTLFETYGKGEPALDYKGLISLAETVRTVHSDLSWHDWRRYSSRQDQEMLMGGLVGNIIYEGNVLNNFLPILKFCETVHIGKQTSFGLGKFELFFEGEE